MTFTRHNGLGKADIIGIDIGVPTFVATVIGVIFAGMMISKRRERTR